MLLDYIAGGELFSRLRKEGRFSIDVALFYSSEILLALQFVHKNDVVYRDLKPENLLIDQTGHIKLADLGFAKVLEDDGTFTLCWTPEYLTTEVVKESK
jgi:serine/threonine protein kinase